MFFLSSVMPGFLRSDSLMNRSFCVVEMRAWLLGFPFRFVSSCFCPHTMCHNSQYREISTFIGVVVFVVSSFLLFMLFHVV